MERVELTWGLGGGIVHNTRDSVDLVYDTPADGPEKAPLELVRLGAHHVETGDGAQNADIAVDSGISLDTDG